MIMMRPVIPFVFAFFVSVFLLSANLPVGAQIFSADIPCETSLGQKKDDWNWNILDTRIITARPQESPSAAHHSMPHTDRQYGYASADVYLGQYHRTRLGSGRIWTNLYYGDTKLTPKDQSENIRPDFYGIQLGLDFKQSHGVYSTYFINVNQSKTDAPEWSAVIDNYLIGYGRFIHLNACQFTLTGSLGYDRYSIDDGAGGGDGLQTNLFGEFGLNLPFGQWALKPFYALQYDFLYHDNLGGSFAQRGHWNGHSLTQLFGTRLNWRPTHRLELQGRAVWVHAMLNNPPPFYHARFSPVSGIHSPAIMFFEGDTGRDWAWLGLGVKFECLFNASLFGDYDVLLNERHVTHLGSVGVCLNW